MATNNVVNNAPTVAGTASQITSTYSGTTATLALATNVVNSNQTVFMATLSTIQSNVTGDGTVYTIVFDVTTINQGSHYSTGTGIFTAHSTGRYLFTTGITFFGAVGATSGGPQLVTTSASYYINYYGAFPASQNWPFHGSLIVPMTSGDTAKIQIAMSGSTKSAILNGSGSPYVT